MIVRGRWTPEDRAESIYRYVPFDVQGGAAGIEIRLRYDRTRAVLDLGAVDPQRFRGWSGSERERVVIGSEEATPGYLPGALRPGTWNILVGLHRVPEDGVEYEADVRIGAARPDPLPPPPPRPERPPRREVPATNGRRWLAGDLHAHTVYSDGVLTIDELACLAAGRGLDFLAITDHNSPSHHPHLPAAAAHAGLILLPGQEVTTDEGHANYYGTGWIDFREPSDAWLDAAEAHGGLLSVNHPLAGDCRWRRPLRRRPPLAEVWHSSWDRAAPVPIAWWLGWGAGHPIGGSDFHRWNDDGLPGQPTTWVEAEDNDVLGALAAGRTAISAGRDGPLLVRHDGGLLALDAEGATLHQPDGALRPITDRRTSLPAGDGPYWLTDVAGMVVALTG